MIKSSTKQLQRSMYRVRFRLEIIRLLTRCFDRINVLCFMRRMIVNGARRTTSDYRGPIMVIVRSMLNTTASSRAVRVENKQRERFPKMESLSSLAGYLARRNVSSSLLLFALAGRPRIIVATRKRIGLESVWELPFRDSVLERVWRKTRKAVARCANAALNFRLPRKFEHGTRITIVVKSEPIQNDPRLGLNGA